MTRKKALTVFVTVLLVAGSFMFGFYACLNLKSTAPSEIRQQYLLRSGDAPPLVRSSVLAALRDFQEGYIKRDPKEIEPFMSRLFPKSDEILLLGTESGEWVRGYPAVSKFIEEDWKHWDNFSFDVDESIISCTGDVAWVAAVGMVRGPVSDRPIRFSATLVRSGNNWQFRQLQFQWDDRDPSLADLFRPRTHLKLGRVVFQKVARKFQ